MADDARLRPSVRPGGFFGEVPRRRRQWHQTDRSIRFRRAREREREREREQQLRRGKSAWRPRTATLCGFLLRCPRSLARPLRERQPRVTDGHAELEMVSNVCVKAYLQTFAAIALRDPPGRVFCAGDEHNY